MGFRFRKRIKILPGITLNIGKSGVSTSIGTRGARVTYGRGKTRATVGIPGTGISHTSTGKAKNEPIKVLGSGQTQQNDPSYNPAPRKIPFYKRPIFYLPLSFLAGPLIAVLVGEDSEAIVMGPFVLALLYTVFSIFQNKK